MAPISAVIMTRNEADTIEDTLESVGDIVEEIVLVDGGSTDGTLDLVEDWSNRNDKYFTPIESSEREYLLEGAGMQRRRGSDAAQFEYILSLDGDTIVEVQDEQWFHTDLDHYCYRHGRSKPSGLVMVEYRLHHKNPNIHLNDAHQEVIDRCRWRGLVHEELRNKEATHIGRAYKVAGAPMIHHDQRHSAMDTESVLGRQQHSHDPSAGGNMGHSLKKQHFLMAQTMASPRQKKYLADAWNDYYHYNQRLIIEHANEIADEYNLPRHYDLEPRDVENNTRTDWWKLEEGEPLMDFETENKVNRIRRALPI